MTAQDRFEQRLSGRLEDLASASTPSYFDDVIQTTAHTRQRPGWSFLERWLPVSTISSRVAWAPRAPMRVLALAVLLVLALAAVLVIVAGSHQVRVPAPFGPADNGRIVWADASGAILAADADGTHADTLVPGPGNDRPLFSPDGTRLLYLHTGIGNELIVTAEDGKGGVTVASGLASIGAIWSPDSRSILIASGGTLSRVDALSGGAPAEIATNVDGTYDWNGESSTLFRPPAGDEIAFVQDAGSSKSIVVSKADGSAPRTILSPATAGFAYTDLSVPRWSPDGSRLVFVATLSGNAADTRVYVMNGDGSDVHRLTDRDVPGSIVSEGNPQWSPDGRRIVMQVWLDTGDQTDVRPLTVVDVVSSVQHEIGSVSPNGFTSFAWSPDGTSVLAVKDGGQLSVIDASNGQEVVQPWTSSSGANWQRINH